MYMYNYIYYMHAYTIYVLYMNEYQSIVPPSHPLVNIPTH